jgi:GDP/UDP-N,N'-diacetylbacillosamine 2-epimerase (hydrolysing)
VKKNKTICIITGTRAEYGLLRPLMAKIRSTSGLSLRIIATGTHLSREFGHTVREIESDGFAITAKVPLSLSSDTPQGTITAMACALEKIGAALSRIKPDIVVVLGDRYEILAAACAATIEKLPIAHIHGGERSEGVFDESFRHAITKMSHLHFVATHEYRSRVIQMGEQPSRVFCVGALGIDNIAGLPLLTKKELERQLKITLGSRFIIVTFHPVTRERNSSRKQAGALLAALDERKDTFVIFTYANSDTDGKVINHLINAYVRTRRHRSAVFPSLGSLRYLSLMRCADAVVGNSSSGIIEAPSFKIGTINIGDRQRGRTRAASVIDCEPTVQGIRAGFRKLYSRAFQEKLHSVVNPYGTAGAAGQIVEILKKTELPVEIKKEFYDITFIKTGRTASMRGDYRKTR